MNKLLLIMSALTLPLSVVAQTIDFESKEGYKSVGIYDTWEQSPFRTGELKGNVRVIDNFLNGSDSEKILAVQRSRFGSNTFGVRIDLVKTFELTPDTQYVHVKIHKPVAGKVMLIGLGKRKERIGQSPETEQFWVYSENDIVTDCWNDAVFAVRGQKGVEIYSLVVVPDCASPHNLKDDFAAYFDDVEVNNNKVPRITVTTEQNKRSSDKDTAIVLNASCRNGYISDTEGRQLQSVRLSKNKPFVIKAVPAPGFVLDYIIIKQKYSDIRVEASKFADDGTFNIPTGLLKENITIVGEFKSTDEK